MYIKSVADSSSSQLPKVSWACSFFKSNLIYELCDEINANCRVLFFSTKCTFRDAKLSNVEILKALKL